jgi:hypothetical protein
MKIKRLPGRPIDWDRRIQGFSQKTLFHESAWLDYVQSVQQRSNIEYYEIRCGPDCIGYFCAIKVRKFMFSFLGSPLPGTGMYMGPLVDQHADQGELLRVLINHCTTERIARLDLINNWLNPGIMQTLGFAVETSVTQVCPLTGGEQAVWARMKGTCRTRIRKAEKNGLVVERADDPGVIEQLQSQYVRCLARKGLKPPYDVRRISTLFHCLGPVDRLFALRVMLRDRVLATGFYPHDDRTMYYHDSGYESDCLQLSPNELLHWTAMKMAIARDIATFNIGGGPKPSRFTEKFGGSLQPYHIYRKNFVPFLDEARRGYHLLNHNIFK